MNRKERASISNETLQILESGVYNGLDGAVTTKEDLKSAVSGTILYTEEDLADTYDAISGNYDTMITVTNETTLEAARHVVEAGAVDPCCLNFASAKNPGGGFLGGSQA